MKIIHQHIALLVNYIYKMLVAFACNGYSSASLSQYKNNPIYQEIAEEYDFGGTNKDDRIYIDMR